MSKQCLTQSAPSERDLSVQGTSISSAIYNTKTTAKTHLEAAEVEDLVHQFQVILHRVNHLWRSAHFASHGRVSHDDQ